MNKPASRLVFLCQLFAAVASCEAPSASQPSADTEYTPDGESGPSDVGERTDPDGESGSDAATLPAVCRIRGSVVECGLVLADIANSLAYQGGTGLSPRDACLSVCAHTPQVIEHWELMLLDLHPCAHLVTIDNFDCSICPSLSNEPVTQFLCDGNPCTQDACAGATCTHTAMTWVGTACKVDGCEGTLSCNEQCTRFPDCLNPENLKMCKPNQGCPQG